MPAAGTTQPEYRTVKDIPPTPAIVHDWSLLTGFRVLVRRDSTILRSGQVEVVTADGQALWLAAEDGFARQLIDQGSGFEVLLEPAQVGPYRQRITAAATLLNSTAPAKKR
jgi:hypothetical protein